MPAAPAANDAAANALSGLVECTRAVLRAHDESQLASTLCSVLTESGVYSEASITFVDVDGPGARGARPHYAGPREEFKSEPERFWSLPAHQQLFQSVLDKRSPALGEPASGRAALPLIVEGRVVAILALATRDQRFIDAGEFKQLQALAADISWGLARLREAARRHAMGTSERRLRETFEHAGVGITRIDLNGRFIEVNQKFCEMLGYERDELIGRATRDVTVAEDYGAGPGFREEARHGRTGTLTGKSATSARTAA